MKRGCFVTEGKKFCLDNDIHLLLNSKATNNRLKILLGCIDVFSLLGEEMGQQIVYFWEKHTSRAVRSRGSTAESRRSHRAPEAFERLGSCSAAVIERCSYAAVAKRTAFYPTRFFIPHAPPSSGSDSASPSEQHRLASNLDNTWHVITTSSSAAAARKATF